MALFFIVCRLKCFYFFIFLYFFILMFFFFFFLIVFFFNNFFIKYFNSNFLFDLFFYFYFFIFIENCVFNNFYFKWFSKLKKNSVLYLFIKNSVFFYNLNFFFFDKLDLKKKKYFEFFNS